MRLFLFSDFPDYSEFLASIYTLTEDEKKTRRSYPKYAQNHDFSECMLNFITCPKKKNSDKKNNYPKQTVFASFVIFSMASFYIVTEYQPTYPNSDNNYLFAYKSSDKYIIFSDKSQILRFKNCIILLLLRIRIVINCLHTNLRISQSYFRIRVRFRDF